MQGIKILDISSYIPETQITNEDFTKIIETSDEWITSRTGIHTRYYALGMPVWEIGYKAAEKVIAKTGISKNEIDLIICTTVTPDTLVPSTACIIQDKLGINGCQAFDINGACSGFVYAVDMAQKYLSSGDYKNILIISAEKLSNITDYKDRSSCILFGDGAAAALITSADASYAGYMGADGSGSSFLKADSIRTVENPFYKVKNIDKPEKETDGLLFQDGKEVYKFAVGIMPAAVEKVLEKAGVSAEDIDMIVPHQANIRIIQTAAAKLNVPMEKVYINIDKYGNTSSASIPIAFSEAVDAGKIKRGDKVVLVGFGAGLTFGAVYFEF